MGKTNKIRKLMTFCIVLPTMINIKKDNKIDKVVLSEQNRKCVFLFFVEKTRFFFQFYVA